MSLPPKPALCHLRERGALEVDYFPPWPLIALTGIVGCAFSSVIVAIVLSGDRSLLLYFFPIWIGPYFLVTSVLMIFGRATRIAWDRHQLIVRRGTFSRSKAIDWEMWGAQFRVEQNGRGYDLVVTELRGRSHPLGISIMGRSHADWIAARLTQKVAQSLARD